MKKRVKKPVSQGGGNQKIPEKPIAENRASGKECCSKRVVAADCCGISSAIGRNLAELSADKAETEEKRKFEQLFTSYQQTMYHIAYRILKNQHDAEDAVQ